MSSIVPNPEEFQKFAASPDEGPLVMLNLLRFKLETAEGSSGRAAYQRHAQNAKEMIQ